MLNTKLNEVEKTTANDIQNRKLFLQENDTSDTFLPTLNNFNVYCDVNL